MPDDVLLAIRIGFCSAVGLCFCGGMVLDSELDVLRKETEEVFCFFKEGASLRASSAPDTLFISFSFFRAPSESDTKMGMGTFSAPFVTDRTPALAGPDPPTFFFLAAGCSPWEILFVLDREVARELAPPLEELVTAMHCFGGLLLVLVAWGLGNSRLPRTNPGTIRVESTSGMGKGGRTSEEAPVAYAMGEGNSGDKGVSSSSLSDPSPVISESPPPRVERVVDALRTLEPLGIVLI